MLRQGLANLLARVISASADLLTLVLLNLPQNGIVLVKVDLFKALIVTGITLLVSHPLHPKPARPKRWKDTILVQGSFR